MALIDLAGVKAKLGISGTDQDAQISALLAGAQAFVEGATGRYEIGERDRIYDGNGASRLVLRSRPVVVDDEHPFALYVDTTRAFTTAAAAALYYVEKEPGIVHYNGRLPTAHASVRVVCWDGYTAETYPEELLSIMAEAVGLMLNVIGAAGLSTESMADYSYSKAQLEQLSAVFGKTLEQWACDPEVM